MLNRRKFLGYAGAVLLAPAIHSAHAGAARAGAVRFAVIDWAMLETALAIGAVPVAATELVQYRKMALDPQPPASVTDLGLRGAPNLELLRIISPDLIVSSNFYEFERVSFEHVAPFFALPVFVPGQPSLPLLQDAASKLGHKLGREAEAQTLIAACEAEIAATRQRFSGMAERKTFLISLGDSRHFRAFGPDSLFGDVLQRLGFENAWTGGTDYSAAAPVGLEQLARAPDASIVVIGPTEEETLRRLPQNALWNALPAVREGRAVFLPALDHFGGLPTARRFLRLLTQHWPEHAGG